MVEYSLNFVSRSRFAASVATAELDILKDSGCADTLRELVGAKRSVKAFAEAFYFVRVNFVKHNFIVGSRLGTDERLWGPLVNNLLEELGGAAHGTVSHNQLYRRFLKTADLDEGELVQPEFTRRFDEAWTTFVQTARPSTALWALAVYEILDAPDYQFLHRELAETGLVPPRGLEFFKIHAEVRHFDLFEDVFGDGLSNPEIAADLSAACNFVLSTQAEMWAGLAEHMRQKARH